jgi:hypothetical protein
VTEWKLVPVEPTEEMIAAIQDAAFAAWDAVVASEFNDDLPTYPPTYTQQQAWKAALDAAPEAPSAEPCPYVRSSSEGTHWCALAEQPADHREVMQLAIEALETSRLYLVDYCKQSIIDANFDAISALRAALGGRND